MLLRHAHTHLGLSLLHAHHTLLGHALLGHTLLGLLHASKLLLEALLRHAAHLGLLEALLRHTAHLGLLVAPHHALLGHALRGELLLLL